MSHHMTSFTPRVMKFVRWSYEAPKFLVLAEQRSRVLWRLDWFYFERESPIWGIPPNSSFLTWIVYTIRSCLMSWGSSNPRCWHQDIRKTSHIFCGNSDQSPALLGQSLTEISDRNPCKKSCSCCDRNIQKKWDFWCDVTCTCSDAKLVKGWLFYVTIERTGSHWGFLGFCKTLGYGRPWESLSWITQERHVSSVLSHSSDPRSTSFHSCSTASTSNLILSVRACSSLVAITVQAIAKWR